MRNEAGTSFRPKLAYFRAAMVVGSESESYRTLRYLVSRLPVMIAPAWLRTPTQPIGVDDLLAFLAAAPRVEAAAGREVQIGGARLHGAREQVVDRGRRSVHGHLAYRQGSTPP